MVSWDRPGKYMNNKFNIYIYTGYFIRLAFLENMVLLVRYLPVIW